LSLWSQRGGISITSSIRYVFSIATTLESYELQQVSGQTVGSLGTHFVGPDSRQLLGDKHSSQIGFSVQDDVNSKGGYTLVTLLHSVPPHRDSVDGTRDRVTYQKLVTR
jgi:hypothetical protein